LWMKIVIQTVGMQAVLGPNTTFHQGSPKLVKQQSQRKTVTRKQVSHSLLCEFNRSQKEQDKEGCSERSAFRWLKEDRPKHAICPHQTDYFHRCKEFKEVINRQKTILQRLRHSGDCSNERL